MKDKLAKQTLLHKAIEHYRHSADTYKIMTLWADDEPYPIDDVISLLKERIAGFQAELEQYPLNESLTQGIRINERLLITMEVRAKRIAKQRY